MRGALGRLHQELPGQGESGQCIWSLVRLWCRNPIAASACRSARLCVCTHPAAPASPALQRIDNTSTRDEPYVFKLGAHEVGAGPRRACACGMGGVTRQALPTAAAHGRRCCSCPPTPSSQPRRPRPPPRRSPRLKRRCRACVWAECAVWRCWASCLSCRTHATAPSALLRLSSEAAAAHGPARVAGLGAGCGSGAGGAALRPGLPPGSAPGARHRAATRRRLARRRYRFGPQPAEFDGQRALSAPAALPCPAAAAAAAAAPLPCSRLHCANGHLSAHSPNSSTATQLPPQTLYWTIKPSPPPTAPCCWTSSFSRSGNNRFERRRTC